MGRFESQFVDLRRFLSKKVDGVGDPLPTQAALPHQRVFSVNETADRDEAHVGTEEGIIQILTSDVEALQTRVTALEISLSGDWYYSKQMRESEQKTREGLASAHQRTRDPTVSDVCRQLQQGARAVDLREQLKTAAGRNETAELCNEESTTPPSKPASRFVLETAALGATEDSSLESKLQPLGSLATTANGIERLTEEASSAIRSCWKHIECPNAVLEDGSHGGTLESPASGPAGKAWSSKMEMSMSPDMLQGNASETFSFQTSRLDSGEE